MKLLKWLLLANICFNHFCVKAQNKVITVNVTDKNSVSKKIWIYLPQNYYTSQKKFPVIYMHDGQNIFDEKTSYSGEWNIDETLDSINAQTIVVAIAHGNEKRINELTPFANEKYGGGNANEYLHFLINTIKPYIDKNYRTKKTKKHTTIAGSSLGGLTSFYAALKFPKIFGKAIVFSPSFWYSNKIYDFAKNKEKIKGKIYFLCGNKESEDMEKDMLKMIEICKPKMKTKNINYKVVNQGEHNEKLWRNEFKNAYLWINN